MVANAGAIMCDSNVTEAGTIASAGIVKSDGAVTVAGAVVGVGQFCSAGGIDAIITQCQNLPPRVMLCFRNLG